MTATFTRLPATLLAVLAIAGAVSPAGAIPASDAAVEAFLGLGNGALDVLIGDNATDGTAVKTTIVVGAPDTTLAFDWVFDSFDGGSSTYHPGYLSAPRRRVTPVEEGSTQTVVGLIW